VESEPCLGSLPGSWRSQNGAWGWRHVGVTRPQVRACLTSAVAHFAKRIVIITRCFVEVPSRAYFSKQWVRRPCLSHALRDLFIDCLAGKVVQLINVTSLSRFRGADSAFLGSCSSLDFPDANQFTVPVLRSATITPIAKLYASWL
jgi:hypothetical protein